MTEFVIVGGGSSGAVLAARLSENPAYRITLLEAGPDFRSGETPPQIAGLPVGPMLPVDPGAAFHWQGLLVRRTAQQEPRHYIRSRCIGGSSSINGQIAIRGMLNDFDVWAANGCKGWSGAEVLPTYCRLETDLDYGFAPWHGDKGPLRVRRAVRSSWGAVDRALAQAGLDLGYGWADDHNAADATGVSPYAGSSTAEYRRVSTNDAYLEDARGRPNLRVIGDALVDRIILDGHWPTATGVRVRIGGAWQEIPGDEIIVAAGALHSPAILMRSGVGPSEILFNRGIKPVMDLAVGGNLQDHPAVTLRLRLKRHARATSVQERRSNCVIRYTSGLAGAGRNDAKLFGINQVGDDDELGILGVTLQQCFSRGRLQIVSADPLVEPTVDENMLSDPRDMIRMRDGVRRLFALGSHGAFLRLADSIALDGSGETPESLADGAAIDAWLLSAAIDCQHPTGTCRMGAADDRRSVVDADCRVHNVKGLRVIDASIMPEIVRANPYLTTVMIAEHMAARLRAV